MTKNTKSFFKMKTKLSKQWFLSATPLILLCLNLVLASCDRGVTIHPSTLTLEMRKECAAALAGLYDTPALVYADLEYDSTFQLRTTILDYDNGMKMVLHDFPLSTLAEALPDSLADLRQAIAKVADTELTIAYNFAYGGFVQLYFTPQDLPFTCQTADGQQHHLRLSLRSDLIWEIGELDDGVLNINLVVDGAKLSLSATALYEDNRPILEFDETWDDNSFYGIFLRFDGRS